MTAPPSSQDLWELFLREAATLVDGCKRLLGDRNNLESTAEGEEAARSLASNLETLEAQAALMGVKELTDLASACKRAAQKRRGDLLASVVGLLGRALDDLAHPDASGAHITPDTSRQIDEAIRAMEGSPDRDPAPPRPAPEPSVCVRTRPVPASDEGDPEIWVPQVDEDMIEPFLEECNERLEALGQGLLALEDSKDPELVKQIFRDLHTLKGSSGFVGLQRMNRLAHAAEDLVGQVREGTREPDRPVIDTLLATLDLLQGILERASKRAPIDLPIEPLLARLRVPGIDSGPELERPSPPPPAPVTDTDTDTGAAKPPPPDRASTLTLRVDFDRLDHLLNLVGELVLGKTGIHQALDALRELTNELDARRRKLRLAKGNGDGRRHEDESASASVSGADTLQGLERLCHELEEADSRLEMVTSRLRDQVMKLRMVPIAHLFNKYRRVVRDMSHRVGKEAQLEIVGAETELDKLLVEQLDDPLLHLVRNAVDHGIESVAARERAGKPPRGTVRLEASHRGSQILIEVSDDGKGIDPHRVGAKAQERGLITEEELERLDEPQLLELIFLPGLSTAAEVTDLSGRGVGMDVVRETISSLKGSIEIMSQPETGTRFVLKLPLTLAISNVLLCRAGGQVLAVPIHAVKHTLMADPRRTRNVAAYPTLKLQEEVPLIDVARTLQLPSTPISPPYPVALVEAMGGTFGLVFEQLLGRQEIVIKSLGSLLERVPCCAGATLLGERCALILDVPALVRRALEMPTSLGTDEHEPSHARPRLLVVEDSDTVRQDLQRLLAAAGFSVHEARDGAEAIALCQQWRFDLVSTDVMMPGIDGYELCRQLRQLPGYQEIPIIMVTGRDQEIDRIRGFDAGVDAYLVKPVDRQQMVSLVERLLGSAPKPLDERRDAEK